MHATHVASDACSTYADFLSLFFAPFYSILFIIFLSVVLFFAAAAAGAVALLPLACNFRCCNCYYFSYLLINESAFLNIERKTLNLFMIAFVCLHVPLFT